MKNKSSDLVGGVLVFIFMIAVGIVGATLLTGCGSEYREDRSTSNSVVEPPPEDEELKEKPQPVSDKEKVEAKVQLVFVDTACNGINIFKAGKNGPVFAAYSSRLFVLGKKFSTIWQSGSRHCKLRIENRVIANYKP